MIYYKINLICTTTWSEYWSVLMVGPEGKLKETLDKVVKVSKKKGLTIN